jgi:hypothetical protein
MRSLNRAIGIAVAVLVTGIVAVGKPELAVAAGDAEYTESCQHEGGQWWSCERNRCETQDNGFRVCTTVSTWWEFRADVVVYE